MQDYITKYCCYLLNLLQVQALSQKSKPWIRETIIGFFISTRNLAQSETEQEQNTKTNAISRKHKSQLILLECIGGMKKQIKTES